LLLDHLDLILALTERGSISAAAEALGLTQSAVTKALSRAEKELGVPLFERQPRGVRPTAYGRALEAHATLIRRQCEDALVELTDLSGGEGGRVAVGSGAAFLDALLPTSVARLLAENPRIEFEIRGEPFPRLMELLGRDGSTCCSCPRCPASTRPGTWPGLPWSATRWTSSPGRAIRSWTSPRSG
jgi:DNA-binding transcriptional LysR family regulator